MAIIVYGGLWGEASLIAKSRSFKWWHLEGMDPPSS